jgi:hypothetical protein
LTNIRELDKLSYGYWAKNSVRKKGILHWPTSETKLSQVSEKGFLILSSYLPQTNKKIITNFYGDQRLWNVVNM